MRLNKTNTNDSNFRLPPSDPAAQSNPTGKPSLTIQPSLASQDNSMETGNFTLDDTPISPRASLFSPKFMVTADNSTNQYQKGTTTYTDAGPVKSRPQVSKPVRETPAQTSPLSQAKPQTFLTIQDLQDVSPLSSFSGPSPSSSPGTREAQNYVSQTAELRRPSYASQLTISSTGSKQIDNDNDHASMHSASPTNSNTHLPEEGPHAGTSVAGRSNSKVNPIVFPQQDEVFDTKEMQRFEELKRTKVEEPAAEISDSPPMHTNPPSRAESVDASALRAKPKKSFLGKLIARRESSADFSEKLTKKTSKHKGSEANIRSHWSGDPGSFLLHKSTAGILTGYPGMSYMGNPERERARLLSTASARSKRADSTAEGPLSKPPSVPESPLGSTSANNYADMMNDIRLELGELGDEEPAHHNPSISAPRQNTSIAVASTHDGSISGPASGNAPPGDPATTWQAPESWNTPATWQAPESWNILPDSVPQWPADYDNPRTSLSGPGSGAKPQRYCVRVFREDGTFGTISCDIDTTVTELMQLLGKKFFLPSVSEYQLTVRTGGLERILLPKERPLVYQRVLLEFMGYTKDDRLHDVGRDDLSYMCRFEFYKHELRTVSEEEKEIISSDFTHADMHHMDLETIPLIYYSHAQKIEHMDVSENPSLTIPNDFIQACVNLQSLRYVRNTALQFPSNILQSTNLRHLDLSSNLISHLDNIDFSKLASLVTLDLHGNRISNLNESIANLKHLESLNLSSNGLTEISVAICHLTTLRQFDISFNKISSLPDEIGLLENLEELAMSNNYLTKSLPDSFVQLKKLTDLDIRYNKLQSIDIINQLPILKVLYCSKNSVTSFSAQFPNLELFFFDRNPLTKIEFVEPHSSLTVLNLSKAKLAALDESFIEKIPLVERLVLDKNHMSSLPAHIGTLKRLMHLSIVSNNLDSVPPEIGLLSELRHLDLHNNNIRSLPEEIWNLACLDYLNVSSNLLESFPKHISQSSVSSSESDRFKSFGELVQNYDMTPNNQARRPSTLSISSGLGPSDRRISTFPTGLGRPSSATQSKDSPQPHGVRPRRTLAQCLHNLSLSDNRLTDECFEEISWLTELQTLNLSYNELIDISYGALRRLSHLTELYLSGNSLTSLPADDIEAIQTLRVLHVNNNKLHSLPAELGKISHLTTLDVGCNNLKYNINNWPYDWNWNYNLDLQYLNFSGNRRLEVKALPHFGRESNEKDLSDFTKLGNIRVLGLMDVTLITPSVPDQTENCRVRTYGSEINSMPFGMADSIGANSNLSIMDMILERFRGKDNEVVVGLFDGRNENRFRGNKVSKLIQETFGGIFTEELKNLRENETTKDALRRAFLNTNKEIGNTTLMPSEEIAHSSIAHRSVTAANLEQSDGMTGSCATIVYIQQNKLYVANAGDSMAIISRVSGEYTVLTTRHDPTSEAELARIRAGAGVVSSNGKLDDVLDVSRAVGFYNLIPHIHATPSITEYDLVDNDEILILGSKQLWEYVSYQIALDVVRMSNGDLMRAAGKLRDFAISYGASDKIMVMVMGVGLSRRRPKKLLGATIGNAPGAAEEDLYPAFKKRRDKADLPEDSRLARLGGEVDPPVGDLAMIFTDIKNSTLLWETSPIAMRSAIKVHNSIMRRHLRIVGGYEVKTEGDAFMVSFPTPTAALIWCFRVQSSLLVADWPAEILETSEGCEVLDEKDEVIFRGLSVRMGIHWGSPVCERDPITRRMDYFGPMVNRAARVSAVADGGQIALSYDFVVEMKRLRDTIEQFRENEYSSLGDTFGGDESLGRAIEQDLKMLDNLGWELKELGEEKLKGLENPEFISLAYQTDLLGRYPIHTQRTLAKREGNNNQSSNPTPSAVLWPSNSKTAVTEADMDMLMKLRNLSIRLENICTRLNPEYSSTYSSRADSTRVTHLIGTSISVAPCSDVDYAGALNHLITRIENCLSTLYLRATIHQLAPLGLDLSTLNIGEVLNVLLQLSSSGSMPLSDASSQRLRQLSTSAVPQDEFHDAIGVPSERVVKFSPEENGS